MQFKNNIKSKNKGFSLAEIMVTIGILGIIIIAITSFQINIIKNNKYSQDSLSAIQDARAMLRTMIKELRSATISNDGSYPLINVATNTISFYSDIDGDGISDKIRYFTASSSLYRGITIPTGNPLSYQSSNENIYRIAESIRNTSTSSIFEYYDGNYTGTSSPLSYPISITDIRLIKINLIIDIDQSKAPISRSYVSQVTLRNLKDNL